MPQKKKQWMMKSTKYDCGIQKLSPEIIFIISEYDKSTQFALRNVCKEYFNIFREDIFVLGAWAHNSYNYENYNNWLSLCNIPITNFTVKIASEVDNFRFFIIHKHTWLHMSHYVFQCLAKNGKFNLLRWTIHYKIGENLKLLATKISKFQRCSMWHHYKNKKYANIYYNLGLGDFSPYIPDDVYDIVIKREHQKTLRYLDEVNFCEHILHYRVGLLGKPLVFRNTFLRVKPFVEGCIASGRLEMTKEYISSFALLAPLNNESAIKLYSNFMKFACLSEGIEMLEYIYTTFPTDKNKMREICIIKDDEKEEWFLNKQLKYIRI